MALINLAAREINYKIVYYGCGLCGNRKTTCVYKWQYSDLTCREWTEEVHCATCGVYTVYDYRD